MFRLAILLLVTGGDCFFEFWEMAFSRQIRFPDSVIREPLKFSNPVPRGQIKLPEETTPPTTAAPPSPTTKPPSPTTKPPSPTTTPPSPTTARPSPTTTRPSPTTARTSPTTARPSPTTTPPSSTTKPPSSTTKPPSSTTARPSSTTARPSSTTAPPSSTTARPSPTTARPSPTTARPSSTPAPLDVELDSAGIIAFINGFRSAIAKGVFPDGSPTKLAQSEGLFKIVDDPTSAKYAAAIAVGTVDVRPPAEYSRAVYSTQLTYASDSTFVRKALDVWYRYAVDVLPADNATYLQRDVTTLDGYAQAVYYKSVRGSCVIRRNIFSTPTGKKGTRLACVFNSRPVVGQTLYPVKRSPTQGKGCTIDCSCQYYSGSNGSKCDTASGLCIAGTGSTFPSHTTPSTGTSTTRTTPSTTTTTTTPSTTTTTTTRSTTTTKTTPSITTTTKKPHTKTTRTTPSITTTTKRPGRPSRPTTSSTTTTQKTTTTTRDPYDINCPGNVGMDVSMREKALIMLNYRRRELASNKVQHSDGAFLPAGANLVTLKYRCDLESAAQAEANKCAASSGSGLEGTSENFYRKKARSKMDALVDGIKSWWNEVRRVGGVNRNTLTFTSANQNSPVRFMTLMAWANVRSMGCGVRQCGRYYNVVCRFDPRGNIVNQAIYKKGKACTACPAGFRRCVDSLCTA